MVIVFKEIEDKIKKNYIMEIYKKWFSILER